MRRYLPRAHLGCRPFDVSGERLVPGSHLFRGRALDTALKRLLDIFLAGSLLLLLAPLILLVAVAISLDSPGPAFHWCRRVGRGGREFGMLKFRKMHQDAKGAALTSPGDERFTRLGRFLAASKLDEVPQLWNVLCGQMSFVGPRPEDASFVALQAEAYKVILTVKPGITGLSQLAFARESEILDPHDRVGDYVRRLLPQKAHLDQLYVARRSLRLDLRILNWTAIAVLVRRDVAVGRQTGRLTLRRSRTAIEAIPKRVPSH
jgi:lipopolysaccharide/colanic/teichoic acid biosynthesis glycosyltransferase